MTFEEAMDKFPGQAGISSYGQPERNRGPHGISLCRPKQDG